MANKNRISTPLLTLQDVYSIGSAICTINDMKRQAGDSLKLTLSSAGTLQIEVLSVIN